MWLFRSVGLEVTEFPGKVVFMWGVTLSLVLVSRLNIALNMHGS